MSSNCGVCKVKISRNQTCISCDGFCNEEFHASCCEVPGEILKFITKVPGLKWTCETCTSIIEKYQPENLNKIFEEKFQKIFENLDDAFSDMKNKIFTLAGEKLSEINEVMLNVSNKIGNSNRNNNGQLYSTALKSKSAIIVKPTNSSQKNTQTKGDFLQEINPIKHNLNILSVKNISNGGIVIGCQDESGVSKLKEVAKDKLAGKYEISDVKNLNPRIRLVGISEKLEESELVEFVRYQNKSVFSENSECKVIKLWPTKKNSNVFQAILQVDVATYNNLMSGGDGKLFVGYDYCNVYDSVQLIRCYKCSGFNHHSDRCTFHRSCPRCTEDHPVKECKAVNLKCVNCVKQNERDKDLNLDVNHAAWDSRCYVYNHKVKEYKAKTYAA